MGFDYKYRGNSKYLFDFMLQKNEKVIFVTSDCKVPSEYRVEPKSKEFNELFLKAKVIIAETWIPKSLVKQKGQIWIQLWHGTPIKRMLFDSFLKDGNLKDKLYLRKRHKEMNKWDYFLTDSIVGQHKLTSSFKLKPEIVWRLGYPRVEWLKKNKENDEKKRSILRDLSVNSNKKVILYVPTWREENLVDNYFLRCDQIGEFLKEDYVVLVKSHPLNKLKTKLENIIYIDEYEDLQSYILVADFLISDYSSVIFDAIAIDIPILLYVKDFGIYSQKVGIYEDIFSDLEEYKVKGIDELISKIQSFEKPFYYNTELKKYYTSYLIENSTLSIYKEIKNLIDPNVCSN